jgi:hypothetical protein
MLYTTLGWVAFEGLKKVGQFLIAKKGLDY